MAALVRIALRLPYTFVVLALLILITGGLAALRTPVDIFPEIRIPIIATVWSYTGLPPDEMSGRITTPFERVLTTTPGVRAACVREPGRAPDSEVGLCAVRTAHADRPDEAARRHVERSAIEPVHAGG